MHTVSQTQLARFGRGGSSDKPQFRQKLDPSGLDV